jgi:hypothetical protein
VSNRLFRNPSTAVIGIIVFLLVFFAGAVSTCSAEEPTLQLEVGSTFVRAETPALGITVTWPEAGPGDADFECGLALVGEYTFEGVTYSNQAGAQCLLVEHLGKLDIGVGGVYLQNVDALNGSRANFSLKLGWRFDDHWQLQWRHWSNAGTRFPNYGRDMLHLVRRF